LKKSQNSRCKTGTQGTRLGKVEAEGSGEGGVSGAGGCEANRGIAHPCKRQNRKGRPPESSEGIKAGQLARAFSELRGLMGRCPVGVLTRTYQFAKRKANHSQRNAEAVFGNLGHLNLDSIMDISC